MRAFAFAGFVAMAAAFGLSGCAATPGPGDYAAAARAHEQNAREHAYLADRNREAAQWQASHGDTFGAAQSQAAATDQTRAARWQQFQANKDSWLTW